MYMAEKDTNLIFTTEFSNLIEEVLELQAWFSCKEKLYLECWTDSLQLLSYRAQNAANIGKDKVI